MRTTVTLDDDLVADAATYSGIEDKSKLINLALSEFVKRSAARRLAALGGSMPDLEVPPRNRGFYDDDSPAKEAARALVAMGGSMPGLENPPRRKSEPTDLLKVAEEPPPFPPCEP